MVHNICVLIMHFSYLYHSYYMIDAKSLKLNSFFNQFIGPERIIGKTMCKLIGEWLKVEV